MFKKYRHKESGEIVEAFSKEENGHVYWYVNNILGLVSDEEFNEQYKLEE